MDTDHSPTPLHDLPPHPRNHPEGCHVSLTTKIEWSDTTWNPVTGCTKVSPGCDHCYAETFAERWRGVEGHHFETGFDMTLRPERLREPENWKKPRRIFVNSMSDLFHDDIPDSFIAEVFATMARTPRHTYQVLTKRHGRMRSLLSQPSFRDNLAAVSPHWPLPHVWLGVSVEDQKWADIRIPALLDTPAAIRFISAEPLLGPVDLAGPIVPGRGRPKLTYWLDGRPHWGPEQTDDRGRVFQKHARGPRIDWVIVGGESGPGARPMHPQWARTIRDQCRQSGVPFLFKQWGTWGVDWPLDNKGRIVAGPRRLGITVADDGTVYQPGDLSYPNGPRYGEAVRAGHDRAHLTGMYRLGKKTAGRVLDGRTWDQYPQPPHNA